MQLPGPAETTLLFLHGVSSCRLRSTQCCPGHSFILPLDRQLLSSSVWGNRWRASRHRSSCKRQYFMGACSWSAIWQVVGRGCPKLLLWAELTGPRLMASHLQGWGFIPEGASCFVYHPLTNGWGKCLPQDFL